MADTSSLAFMALGPMGYPIYAGERAYKAQKNAAKDQRAAAKEAENRVLSQSREAAMARNKAAEQMPDLARLLSGAEQKPKRSTLGVNHADLVFGTRLLGA